MPELPEVETIVQNLRLGRQGNYSLPGRKIISALLFWPRSLATPTALEFSTQLPGQLISNVNRRGKFIIITLVDNYLLIHLRMSGDVRVEKAFDDNYREIVPRLHDRAIINFEDGTRLAFNDPRKFGRIWLVSNLDDVLADLGPEPLGEDFTPQLFAFRLKTSRRQIKPLLLDQSFLAGMGNIYTDEALHMAGIHPLNHANSLSEKQVEKLWQSIRYVLNEGIRHNGASIDWVYRGGDFQNKFRVYQKTGQPCPVCGTSIRRMEVGQRGTHFCPVCQPYQEVES